MWLSLTPTYSLSLHPLLSTTATKPPQPKRPVSHSLSAHSALPTSNRLLFFSSVVATVSFTRQCSLYEYYVRGSCPVFLWRRPASAARWLLSLSPTWSNHDHHIRETTWRNYPESPLAVLPLVPCQHLLPPSGKLMAWQSSLAPEFFSSVLGGRVRI